MFKTKKKKFGKHPDKNDTLPLEGKKSNDSRFLIKNYRGQEKVTQNFQVLKKGIVNPKYYTQ